MQERQLSEQEMIKEQEILQELVNAAFNDGIVSAIDKAKTYNDPYVLDAFHDLLVDKLYEELVKRDKLKEI
ncbi:hypothetical protein HY249_02315 [Candidatus Azambacteria bacterium]|nr:hypothetical protein [Candidatus Azambacteria bacterium]